ncbi:MAG: hypothetical protein ACOX6H_02830 [Christensenellales bacterium]|jgi:hypothetical protein
MRDDLMIKRKGVIVCGFFGIGKSSVNKFRPDVSFYDLDAKHFVKQPGWEKVYVECALALRERYDIVALKSSDKVMNRLADLDEDFFLVYPNRYAKRDFVERAIKNGYSREWIQNFFAKWDEYLEEVEHEEHANKIVLQNGEYLSDIVDRLIRFK